MYRENIDELIKKAMLAQKKLDLKVLRLIKAEYQTFSTTKDNKGNLNVLDDVQEIKILKKLHKQWKDEWQSFIDAGRTKEALELGAELKTLEALIPAEPSEEETETKIKNVIESYLLGLPIEERKSMKHLGAIMKLVKADNPLADGKLVSSVYKKIIGL